MQEASVRPTERADRPSWRNRTKHRAQSPLLIRDPLLPERSTLRHRVFPSSSSVAPVQIPDDSGAHTLGTPLHLRPEAGRADTGARSVASPAPAAPASTGLAAYWRNQNQLQTNIHLGTGKLGPSMAALH